MDKGFRGPADGQAGLAFWSWLEQSCMDRASFSWCLEVRKDLIIDILAGVADFSGAQFCCVVVIRAKPQTLDPEPLTPAPIQ